MFKAFAIDLGATSAKCAFFENDQVIATFTHDTTSKKDILKNIAKKAFEVGEENNIKIEELDFVGIAVCGIVDNKTGNVIYSTNLGWENYPVKEKLKELFKTNNAVVLNDAKAATYGEWSKSLNSAPDSMALFTIGTGIGGGAIFNRKLVFGDNTGLPSEPGHGGGFQDEYQCPCGLKGCLEQLSSATGIEKKLREVGSKSTGPLGEKYKQFGENLHIIDIADLFHNDDLEVISIFKKNLEPLCKCISVLIHFFDLSTIVIGGGPSNLGEKFLDIIKDNLKDYVLKEFYKRINISIAKLGNLVGSWGVYKYGIDFLFNNNKG